MASLAHEGPAAPNEKSLIGELVHAAGGAPAGSREPPVRQLIFELRDGKVRFPYQVRWQPFSRAEVRVATQGSFVSVYPFPGPWSEGVFTRDTVWIESASGQLLQKRSNLPAEFGNFRHRLWWTDLDRVYFLGFALWSSLSIPFSLLQPNTRISPERIPSEGWMRLRVLFPESPSLKMPEHELLVDPGRRIRRVDFGVPFLGSWARISALPEWRNSDAVPVGMRLFWTDPVDGALVDGLMNFRISHRTVD